MISLKKNALKVRDVETGEFTDVAGFVAPPGEKGDTGPAPVRGVDYWTESDKAEIKAYVDEAILGGAW